MAWAAERVPPVDMLLRGLPVEGQARVLVEYARDLYVRGGYRGRDVTSRLFAVRDAMNGQILSTACFLWESVIAAGGAARLNTQEIRERAVRAQATVKLPAPVEVADLIRGRAFANPDDYSFDGVLGKACSLAITLAMHTGNRPGSVVGTATAMSERDHRTLVGDIVFKGSDGSRARAGPEMAARPVGFAVSAEIMAYSSKSGFHSKVPLLLGGPGVHGEGALGHLVPDLEGFHRNAGHSLGEPFFSFYRRGRQTNPVLARKVVTQHDLRGWLKWAAGELGIPEQHISLGSLRKGYATTSAMEGIPLEEVQSRGGWARGSGVTKAHYDHSSQLALGEGERVGSRSLTVGDVLNMVPHSSGASSSRR